jgi:ribosomal small subunit protein bTHX
MGKGDVKSKKGKLVKGSFGNSRLRKSNKKTAEKAATPKPAPAAATK